MVPTGISYEFGPFRADPRERRLWRGDRIVPVTSKVFDILLFLIQNSGRLLTKDKMMEQLWPDTTVEESNLARNVSSLRKALGENPDEPQYIETVPKQGYRFIASVREVPGAPVEQDSLAVLPFVGEGLDAESEYLPSGLTSILIDKLSLLEGLKVLSSSAVFRYRERCSGSGFPDLMVIGRELGIRAVVTGRVVKIADSLTVDVELVDARDNSHVWGGRYHRSVGDIVTMEETIAQDIAGRLRLRLTTREKEGMRRDTEDAEAHVLYLKGRFFWQKMTPDGVQKGLGFFQKAIEKDPDYALAYVGLMNCHTYLGSPAEARRAANMALELDPLLGEAHASRAFAAFLYDWDWETAEWGFRRAIELNPNHAEAHHWYAIYLAHLGRHEEALREARLAQDLDPLSLLMSQTAGMVLCLARLYDQAIDALLKTLEMDENYAAAHSTLGLVYAEKGMCDKAVAEFEKVLALAGKAPPVEVSVKALMGYAYAASGNRDEALKLAKEVSTLTAAPPYQIAAIYATVGETKLAFEWLERAYSARSFELVGLKVNPGVDKLRSDPRFDDLLKRVGLVG
jgi:DNA-binding winged helix-turn-helix (wHTH) protein/tetratricopeptide (TPR) repeat protein